MQLKKVALLVPALALAVSTFSVPELANAATAGSTVRAEIVARAITLTNVEGLDFGEILPFSSAGFVQVSPTGSFTVNNAQVIDSTSLQPSSWSVVGVSFGRYTISLPTDSPPIELNNGAGNTMLITGFNHNAGTTPQLNGSGAGNFAVGARLNVGANQQPGIYTGSFNVTVNYL